MSGKRWRITGFPKDGSEILIKLRGGETGLLAYWDDELQTFVLSRPLHIESEARPKAWRPK